MSRERLRALTAVTLSAILGTTALSCSTEPDPDAPTAEIVSVKRSFPGIAYVAQYEGAEFGGKLWCAKTSLYQLRDGKFAPEIEPINTACLNSYLATDELITPGMEQSIAFDSNGEPYLDF